MKNLDPNKLFELFSKEEEYQEDIQQKRWISKDNPFILMGMVVRGVENYHIITEINSTRSYQKSSSTLKRQHYIKYSYYKSLYKYLERLNINSMLDLEQCLIHDIEIIDLALNDMRSLFEEFEEYEKCALIRDVQERLLEVHSLTSIEE